MSSDGIEYGWGSPAPRECKEVCEGRRLAKKREVWRRNTYCDACLGSVPMGADLFYVGDLLQETDGVGSNALSRACKAQLFLGGGLDADLIHVHPEGGGDILSHVKYIGG